MNISLRKVPLSEKQVLWNLLQFCLYDFSGFSDGDWGAFNTAGQFDYTHFDDYWRDARRFPYFIFADDALIGFCLVNDYSLTGRPVDFVLAEFFIARKYRKAGYGRIAALELFKQHRGVWELGVMPKNTMAKTFWKSVLSSPVIKDMEGAAGDGVRWKGFIFRFFT